MSLFYLSNFPIAKGFFLIQASVHLSTVFLYYQVKEEKRCFVFRRSVSRRAFPPSPNPSPLPASFAVAARFLSSCRCGPPASSRLIEYRGGSSPPRLVASRRRGEGGTLASARLLVKCLPFCFSGAPCPFLSLRRLPIVFAERLAQGAAFSSH